MKGWIDRVYAWGFAYGVGENRRFSPLRAFMGKSTFVGKRAMLIVTAGGWAESLCRAGSIFHLTTSCPHSCGMLFYPGFEVLPPLVFYRTDKTDAGQFADQ